MRAISSAGRRRRSGKMVAGMAYIVDVEAGKPGRLGCLPLVAGSLASDCWHLARFRCLGIKGWSVRIRSARFYELPAQRAFIRASRWHVDHMTPAQRGRG